MTIREDQCLAAAAGKNPARYKVFIFCTAGGMAAVAGAEYASYVSFIDPTSFTVLESIFILSVVVIGGAGSFWGPIVGSVVLVSLPELLRLVALTGSAQGNIRQILYGSILVIMMVWRPYGLLGRYAFTARRG
jgi:branched-chain amino acid transport system permease protein